MSAAQTWFEGLDAELRALVLQVIASPGDPTDAQLAEAPELIGKPWSFDRLGIPADKRDALTAAIAQLATQLRGPPRRR